MRILVILLFAPMMVFSQEKTYQTMRLGIPETGKEPNSIEFAKEGIVRDEKLCFRYELKHNVFTEYGKSRNYYEITSLDGKLVFSGIIYQNEKREWEGMVSFPLIDKKGYKNSKIISRKDLILNLSSSQVINNDFTIKLDNLKLFYEKSNENKEKNF